MTLERGLVMEDVLGYNGKSVVVTGAASGMGQAATQLLVELGADVTALDIQPTTVPAQRTLGIDLRDRASIEEVAASIDGPIDGLFSCAGLPGPPFSEWDTILVNFVGARHLAELLVPKMAKDSAISVISSSAAIGWQKHIGVITELLETRGFDAAVDWLYEREETWSWSGYAFSKYVLDAWAGWWYADLGKRGIRINCINPGPTRTAMLPVFQSLDKSSVDQAVGPVGRFATAEEQAWPLVCLGSPRLSYVGGEVLWTDGGWSGAITMGRQQAQWAQDTEQIMSEVTSER
jgi:NAD(P)-dependent dehydrogenase (short-subunit alcohol dehydrogenase family)